MGFALTNNDQLYVVTCADCGMAFGVPQQYEDQRRGDHRNFYCPNGHTNYYPQKSTSEKLRDQLAAAQAEIVTERNRRQWAEENEKATGRRLSATKGKVTLLKRRTARGQCPCCKEKFGDLQKHMDKQHPGYGGDE